MFMWQRGKERSNLISWGQMYTISRVSTGGSIFPATDESTGLPPGMDIMYHTLLPNKLVLLILSGLEQSETK